MALRGERDKRRRRETDRLAVPPGADVFARDVLFRLSVDLFLFLFDFDLPVLEAFPVPRELFEQPLGAPFLVVLLPLLGLLLLYGRDDLTEEGHDHVVLGGLLALAKLLVGIVVAERVLQAVDLALDVGGASLGGPLLELADAREQGLVHGDFALELLEFEFALLPLLVDVALLPADHALLVDVRVHLDVGIVRQLQVVPLVVVQPRHPRCVSSVA